MVQVEDLGERVIIRKRYSKSSTSDSNSSRSIFAPHAHTHLSTPIWPVSNHAHRLYLNGALKPLGEAPIIYNKTMTKLIFNMGVKIGRWQKQEINVTHELIASIFEMRYSATRLINHSPRHESVCITWQFYYRPLCAFLCALPAAKRFIYRLCCGELAKISTSRLKI
jgi:hypothetical protein